MSSSANKLLVVALVTTLVATATAVLPLYRGASQTPRMPVGTNLPPVLGTHAECPFVNVMRCAPQLTISYPDLRWYNPANVSLRASDGYPAGLLTSPRLIAHTTVLSQLTGSYRAGSYEVRFTGTGTVTLSGDAAYTAITTPGTTVIVQVAPSAVGIRVFINASDPSDPVRDIIIRHSSLANTASAWDPQWVALLANFSVLRTVHAQREEHNGYTEPRNDDWTAAPSPTWYTFTTEKGVPHQVLAALAQETGKSLWVTVPQFATEDYIRNMAQVYAAALTRSGQVLYLEQSHRIGYMADVTPRVARLKSIFNIVKSVFAVNQRFEVLITCDILCAEFNAFLEPTSTRYDAAFRTAIAAVAVPGEVFAGNVPWVRDPPNPYYMNIEPYMSDVRRVAWEEMQTTEIDYIRYIGRRALWSLPVYAFEGGINLAVEMFGARFENPNGTDARIQNQMEALFHGFEERNDPQLRLLWLEWLERWYRIGGGLFIAGQVVAPGFKCRFQDTRVSGANRWQCNFRGLTRTVADAQRQNKFVAVQQWIAGSPDAAATLAHAPESHTTTCSGRCVWGTCDTEGRCQCFNGYSGASCETFDAALLPNRCSPNDYGANLGGSADWEPVWFWTNFMNFARSWIHQPVDQVNTDVSGWVWSYPNKTLPPLDSDGYPLRLDPNDAVSTFLRRDTYEYPHELYHVFYDGDGTIVFGMDTVVVRRVRPGYVIVRTQPVVQLNNGLWLQIIRTNPDDRVRNIKVVPHSVLHLYRFKTFHPLFLQSMERFKFIRFMTVQHVGGDLISNSTNDARSWADRTKPTFYSQTASRDGWSIEHVVALANQLHIRPWINIPYNANDDYVRNQAKYIKANLNPLLKPIIEYSNEVWATHHYVGFYAADMAVLRGLADGNDEVRARACWNKRRSTEIWAIYVAEGVAVTRVLGGQAVYSRPLREALTCPNTGANSDIDMLVIAPYFGVPLETETGTVATMPEVFAAIPRAINASAQSVVTHAALAAEFGIPAVGLYEAGPSFFGGARGDDPDVQELGTAVHRDPRMREAVAAYFDALRAAGSSLNAYFVAPAAKLSKYGAWGIREYQNQDPSTAPKLLGFEQYAAKYAVPASTCGGPSLAPQAASSCPLSCSGHGECLRPSYNGGSPQCVCYFGYQGPNCSATWRLPNTEMCNRFTCADKNGTCQITATEGVIDKYTCTGCSAGWRGWHCHLPDCGLTSCNYNGKCTAPNTCTCFRGHTGARCEVDCGCAGHGRCASDNRCECDAGYRFESGRCVPSCACATCLGPNICGCSQTCVNGACYNGRCHCWAGFEGATCSDLSATPSPNAESKAGINVAGIADWTSTIEFVNLMYRSRNFFVNPGNIDEPSTRWTLRESLELRTDGYPARIGRDRVAGTFITRDTQNYIPGGRYTLLYDGDGDIEVEFDAKEVPATRAKGFMEVDYRPTTVLNNGFYLRILATNPENPIRNIRVYPPGFNESYADAFVFHPAFLSDLRQYRALRFMPWANLEMAYPGGPTNNTRRWADRKRRTSASMATTSGVSEELMIDLCNWLNADPWFTVPHDADDEYVRNMARLVKLRLRPDVKIHIEHANEVWNSNFQSNRYAAARGAQMFPAVPSWQQASAWHGFRSNQIFSIFADVFGPGQRQRLQFKLGTFVLIPSLTRMALQQVTHRPLSIAITTYFCDESTMGGASAAMTKTTSELVQLCNAEADGPIQQGIREHLDLARTLGLSVDSYEGGPSLVQYNVMFGGYARPGTAELYDSMHRSPSMATIVPKFLDKFDRAGVGLNMWFTSAARPSVYGSWGIKVSTAEPCNNAPKCRALDTWIRNNQNSTVRRIDWSLAEYGFANTVRVEFSSPPSTAEIDAVARRMETQQGLARGSIVGQLVNNTPTTPAAAAVAAPSHRQMSQLQSAATVLFIVVRDQRTASSTLSQRASAIDVNQAVTAAGVTATVVSSRVDVAATPIRASDALPADLVDAPETFVTPSNAPLAPTGACCSVAIVSAILLIMFAALLS